MSKSILLVEDDQNCEELMMRALHESNIAAEIVVARNAGEAVGHLIPAGARSEKGPAARPCVVFLDLSLPSGDGLELLRCIRADYAIHSLPVVIFSASTQGEDIRRAYEEGANSYVRKPANADELFEAVRLLAAYWLTLNESAPRI